MKNIIITILITIIVNIQYGWSCSGIEQLIYQIIFFLFVYAAVWLTDNTLAELKEGKAFL